MYSFLGIGLPDKSLDKDVQLTKCCIYGYVSASVTERVFSEQEELLKLMIPHSPAGS